MNADPEPTPVPVNYDNVRATMRPSRLEPRGYVAGPNLRFELTGEHYEQLHQIMLAGGDIKAEADRLRAEVPVQ